MDKQPQWRAIGQSVQGAAHVRMGLPNQDAILWYPESGEGPPLILAVSDGHGSAKCFRSHIGARLATEAAVRMLRDLLAGQPDPPNLSAIKRTAEERLPRELVRWWREAVDAHLEQTPLSQEELETLEKRRDAKARRAVEDNPVLAYGATILSALVTDAAILYLQLGDGDILVTLDNGEVMRPLPQDARLFANETTSLCMDEAWHEVRFRFQALYGPLPALILLATDGYANSFVNEAAFLKVGADILDILRTDGLAAVEDNLPLWLDEASQAGSGDDITLGLICRKDVLDTKRPSSEPSAELQSSEEKAPKASGIPGDAQPPAASSPSEGGPLPSDNLTDGAQGEKSPEKPPPKPSVERHPARSRRIRKEEGPQEPVKPWVELVTDGEE
jgi:serine/threonine protein phosphatase PrpC